MIFRREQYSVVRCALSPETAALVHRYANLPETEDQTFWHAETESWNRYGDPLGDSILLQLQKIVEEHTQYNLLPTYSYLRNYGPGSVLKKHSDRPSCEVSATLCLGYVAPGPWPFFVESRDGDTAVQLKPGDMLVYMCGATIKVRIQRQSR